MRFLDKLGIPVALSLPASGAPGEVIYYNGAFYGWTGSAWADFSTVSPGFVVTAASTGESQAITLPESDLTPEDVVVTVSGLVQDPSFYTISGTTLTLTAPDTGLSIVIRHGDGSIGSGGSSGPSKYRIGFSVEEVTPSPTEVLLRHVFDTSVTFADDFAGSVARLSGINPSTTQTLSVKHNGTEIGAITVPAAGPITFTTIGGSLTTAIGDEFRVEAPVADPAPELLGMAVTFLGEES